MASVLSPFVLALLCTTPALGATASIDPIEDVIYEAASGEVNEVKVVAVEGLFRITDPGAVITAGVGCTSVGPHEVTCPITGIFKAIEIRVWDEADSVAVSPWPTMLGLLYGGGGNDLLKGGGLMVGAGGNDTLLGSTEFEDLVGGPGNDILRGGGGTFDRLYGGDGNDTIYGSAAKDRVYAGLGQDIVQGGADEDLLFGGRGADRLYGGLGGDQIEGRDGNDRIYGGAGRDRLLGDAGSDTIIGGDGHDELRGGHGNDVLYARDGVRDVVLGNLGFDRARVNVGLDLVHEVEQRF